MTNMVYSVYLNGSCVESLCYSLKEAKTLAKSLLNKGLGQVEIYQYDRGGNNESFLVESSFSNRRKYSESNS